MGKLKTKERQTETGPDLQDVWVEAPLKTWAQYMHELDSGLPQAGRERVQVDRRTLMGGFCRFHGSEAQEKAAARFKAIYESSQVGGAKAVDPSREAVSGGGINPESVIEIGADARQSYNRMHSEFGVQFMRHIEFVVIGDHGPTAYARWLHRGKPQSGQVTGRCAVELRRMMDRVAVHLKLQTRATA